MQAILDKTQSILLGLGVGLATLGIIIIGAKAIFLGIKGEGLRSVFSGIGTVAIGLVLMGAAATLAAAIRQLFTF